LDNTSGDAYGVVVGGAHFELPVRWWVEVAQIECNKHIVIMDRIDFVERCQDQIVLRSQRGEVSFGERMSLREDFNQPRDYVRLDVL